MGDLWPYLVSAAVVGVLSPLAAVACIMLLASRQPLTNALAYLGGWTLILTLVGILGLSLLDPGRNPETGGAAVKATVDLLVGVVLVAAGVRSLAGADHPVHDRVEAARQRAVGGSFPPPGEDAPPKWLTNLETMRPAMALVLGMAMVAVNLPNLAVFLTALQSIATAGLSTAGRLTAMVILLVCIDLALLLPIVVYALLPERSSAVLDRTRRWLLDHLRATSAAGSLGFGAIFVLKGVLALM